MNINDIVNSPAGRLNPGLIQEPVKKKSKYGNKKVVIDGDEYDSGHEGKRWGILRMRVKAKEITGLSRQVTFHLLSFKYIADFVYYDIKERMFVVEDAKSVATRKIPGYIMKKKAMLNELGIIIKEI